MNLLFTGRGSSGSWAIRGSQLGEALGAKVKPHATLQDCRNADLIVVVKRITDQLLTNIGASGKPWVYDCVDFYPQPTCSSWSRDEAIAWVKQRLAQWSPNGIIWPNKRMQQDCGGGGKEVVLYHHHRPGTKHNPIRSEIRTIGYEGADYVSDWMPAIQQECSRRGWKFVANPKQLADLDIVLAVRGEGFNGYAQQHWKSNVKLANAHGSGTPFVGQSEDGYLETASGAEYWAADPSGLKTCFDWLTDEGTREMVSQRFLQRAYTVDQAAADLRRFLDGV